MRRLVSLKILVDYFFNRRESKGREMKRVFQWRRYLDWKNLTPEEKISAKRFLLIPVFAYLIIEIFNKNLLVESFSSGVKSLHSRYLLH